MLWQNKHIFHIFVKFPALIPREIIFPDSISIRLFKKKEGISNFLAQVLLSRNNWILTSKKDLKFMAKAMVLKSKYDMFENLVIPNIAMGRNFPFLCFDFGSRGNLGLKFQIRSQNHTKNMVLKSTYQQLCMI